MEKRKEIEIPKELMESEWKTNKVVIKRPTGGELMRIRDEAGGKEGVAVILTMRSCVAEAPFKVNDAKTIQDLDSGVFLFIVKEIETFINFGDKKKEN